MAPRQFTTSRLRMWMAIGDPSLHPSASPVAVLAALQVAVDPCPV
jgi:hypothetical protein